MNHSGLERFCDQENPPKRSGQLELHCWALVALGAIALLLIVSPSMASVML